MKQSAHNILSKIKDSENHFILNLLTGEADLLTKEESNSFVSNNISEVNPFVEKGYLCDEMTESKKYKEAYLNFIEDRDRDEVQLFFVPSYACNFDCSYCYQSSYTNQKISLTTQVIDAFFNYLKIEFVDRKKYITLFGGEPLMTGVEHKKLISYFLEKAKEASIDVCVVTNGYTLEEYIETLKAVKIREIQITLDGTQAIHDERRYLKGHKPTFEKIVKGVDACLEEGFPVNLRVVIDKDNIENLNDLATFAIEKGWTNNPLFKTQIGRNYELHHCNSSPDKLFTRVSLYEHLFDLIKKYPHIEAFYKPAYSVSKYLSETGELPEALFDSCPACKTEWAFDYTGSIYSCTATVGKDDEKLGTFFPVISKNEKIIDEWQERDVTSIADCKGCNLQLACGGGCGSVAKNKNGSILSPDCRPINELLSLGFAAYFKESE